MTTERLAPDAADARIREMLARVPGALATRIRKAIGQWPPPRPIETALAVIDVNGGKRELPEVQCKVWWAVVETLFALQAHNDFEAGRAQGRNEAAVKVRVATAQLAGRA